MQSQKDCEGDLVRMGEKVAMAYSWNLLAITKKIMKNISQNSTYTG
jgi:hypothetical protein